MKERKFESIQKAIDEWKQTEDAINWGYNIINATTNEINKINLDFEIILGFNNIDNFIRFTYLLYIDDAFNVLDNNENIYYLEYILIPNVINNLNIDDGFKEVIIENLEYKDDWLKEMFNIFKENLELEKYINDKFINFKDITSFWSFEDDFR